MNIVKLKELLTIYHFGLSSHLFNIADIKEVCDKIISKNEEVPYCIIEISSNNKLKINDIEQLLNEFHNHNQTEQIVSIVISIISYKLENKIITEEETCKILYSLLNYTNLNINDKYIDLAYLDDAYDLAKKGIHHSLEDVNENLYKSLNKFNKYYSKYITLCNHFF